MTHSEKGRGPNAGHLDLAHVSGVGRWPCGQAWVEFGLIVILCYLHAGSPPPAVNEPHYLGKAKQYWNPAWCQGDFFLESADAHVVFYWTFGWVTRFASLPVVAAIGRFVVWALFALAWRSLLRRITLTPWASVLSVVLLFWFVHDWHLAGEWLIGGIEAKGFAYPLVFLAMASVVQGRWWLAWPLLGIASSFHILVGGWAVIATFIAWCLRREQDQLSFSELAIWLVIGGACALPGILPAINLTSQATPLDIREANIIYTFRRLSHHLILHRFSAWRIVAFSALVFGWWYTQAKLAPKTDRFQRLNAIVWGSLLIAVAGIAVDMLTSPLPNLRASVMRFYWFRLSDIMLPVGTAIALVAAIDSPKNAIAKVSFVVAIIGGCVGLGMSMGSYGFAARPTALQQQRWPLLQVEEAEQPFVDHQWQTACHWIRDNTPLDVVFLTPTQQQTFKWFAERPEVVVWKDVPQDAGGLVDWWERRKEVHELGPAPWKDVEKFANLVQRYGVTHIAWPNATDLASQPVGDLLYRNQLFTVTRLYAD